MLILREKRKDFDMTQKELAILLGLSTQAISHYEKGIREPSQNTLIKLSEIFQCTVDDLIKRDHH